MSWISKFFPKIERSDNKDETITQVERAYKTEALFAGIDYEFIDKLYFHTAELKDIFIYQLNEILTVLKISEQTKRVETTQLLTDYITNKEIEIPFLIYLFNFETYSIEIDKVSNIEISKKIAFASNKGKEKLSHYYTGLNVASYNIEKKIAAGYLDFLEEEELINRTLSDEHYDFARISGLFLLGHGFFVSNNIEKMEYYFNIIKKDKYELSNITVSEYYRAIGEEYYNAKILEKSLIWLKDGITLNPKLGVKKLIQKIENELI
ncbi:hypothetical protein LK994_08265 [Ferruginibacter lapsinanis]|uniref:hypothetical protein n=1 Tax=Ferruginibacter lapsinanis TaxID=563172 RepID=UPI001E459008|nr:hypothetical protein [Ferruginibacter lapsinanis]UEG48629.1 hypothetical protein LK994_08265 [Ferruginibacter lapsinanis]